MSPLKYKVIHPKGEMICRCRYEYDAALIASKYDIGTKIRNEQLGASGRVVHVVDQVTLGDYNLIYQAIEVGERTAIARLMWKK